MAVFPQNPEEFRLAILFILFNQNIQAINDRQGP